MSKIDMQIFCDSHKLNKYFDPDEIDSPIVAIYASSYFDNNHPHTLRSSQHSHQKGQLTFIQSGQAVVELNEKTINIPSHALVWIPAGIPHCITVKSFINYRSIFINPNYFPYLSAQVEIISASKLMEEVIESMCRASFLTDWSEGKEYHLRSILIESLPVNDTFITMPKIPTDVRVYHKLATYVNQHQPPPKLKEIINNIGVSERTLHRIFIKEVGMTYQDWRQKIRLVLAMKWLSKSTPILDISYKLGFSSYSAFISFFKQHLGITPTQFQYYNAKFNKERVLSGQTGYK